MKADERVSERISHLERDIKILKNEVQAVLVDLREKYMLSDSPSTISAPVASPQPVGVLTKPEINKENPDTDSRDVAQEKESKDKGEEPAIVSEPAEAKKDAPEKASEAGKEDHPDAAVKADRDKTEDVKERSETENVTKPGTAREEVSKAQIPDDFPLNAGTRGIGITCRDINLISVSGLVNWAEESVKKLGHQKTEAILDVAELMGLLSPQLKQIMIKLINIDRDNDSQSVSARVFLDSLVRITALLGRDNQTEAALLSILSGEEDDHG